MSVTVIYDPERWKSNHDCDLPPARQYEYGTKVACDDCGRVWKNRNFYDIDGRSHLYWKRTRVKLRTVRSPYS